MSIAPPRADTRRRCFRPCRPGTFCRCKGRTIPREEPMTDTTVSQSPEVLAMATCGLDTITPAYVIEADYKPVAWCDDPEIARQIKDAFTVQSPPEQAAQNNAVRERLAALLNEVENTDRFSAWLSVRVEAVGKFVVGNGDAILAALAATPPAPVEPQPATQCRYEYFRSDGQYSAGECFLHPDICDHCAYRLRATASPEKGKQK